MLHHQSTKPAPTTALPGALSSVALFWQPDTAGESSLTRRLPFLFWLLDVLRPLRVAQFGLGLGESYAALCYGLNRLGGASISFGSDPVLQEGFAAAHDLKYAARSRLIEGDAEALAHRIAPGSIDLLVIEPGTAMKGASDVQATLTSLEGLLSPHAAVLVPGAPKDLSLQGAKCVHLSLGEEDILLFARPGAGDDRFAALMETPPGSAERQILESLFTQFGLSLLHQTRGQQAAGLKEQLTQTEAARVELAAAYVARHKTAALLQAQIFDVVQERDLAVAKAVIASKRTEDLDRLVATTEALTKEKSDLQVRYEVLLKENAEATRLVNDLQTQTQSHAEAVEQLTALTQEKRSLQAQVALRFRELAILTTELERVQKLHHDQLEAAKANQIEQAKADAEKLTATDAALADAKARHAETSDLLGTVQAKLKAEQAKLKAEQAKFLAEQAKLKAEKLKIKKLMASHSWKITKPLRWLSRLGRKVVGRG